LTALRASRELMKCKHTHQELADTGVIAAALQVISVDVGRGDDGPEAVAAALISDAASSEGPLRGAVIVEVLPLVARLAGAGGGAAARGAVRAAERLTNCCEELDKPLLAAGAAPALVARLWDRDVAGAEDAAWAIRNLACSGEKACSTIMACMPLPQLLDLARGGRSAAERAAACAATCAVKELIVGNRRAARVRARAAAAAGAREVLRSVVERGAADETARDAAEAALRALAAAVGQQGNGGRGAESEA
jgi:hypothetical protein